MSAIDTFHIDRVVVHLNSRGEFVEPNLVNLLFLLTDRPTDYWATVFAGELRDRLPEVDPVGGFVMLTFAGEEPAATDTNPPVARFTDSVTGEYKQTVFALNNIPVNDQTREQVVRDLAKVVDAAVAETNSRYVEAIDENRQKVAKAVADMERVQDSINASYDFIR